MSRSDDNCRLCLNDFNNKNFSPLFPHSTSDGPSLSTKIMICLSLPIEYNNSFSNKICEHCTEKVTRFYDFRDKCLKTHYSLFKNDENYKVSNDKLDEQITDKYQEVTPQSEESVNTTSYYINQEIESPVPLLHSNPNEINSTSNNQLEMPPLIPHDPTSQDQTISIKTESQNSIYEYKCLHCSSLFSDLDAASMHCMECSNSPQQMNYPVEKTINTEQNSQTIDTEHEQDRNSNSSKQFHKRNKTEKTNKECSECSAKFSNLSLLKRHMSVHTGERPFACDTCNRRFSQIGQLNFHRKFHLNPRYRCKVCEKPFLRPSDIEKHMRTHTGEKPFTCEICDKSFAQLVALKQHERVHTGDKPYICEICNKQFSQKANKTKHLKIHKEGAKPHTCEICGRSFSEYKEMMLHRAGHGGGKPRECDHCDERFRKLSELSDHIRRYHTFERPHKCAFCSKAFYSLYNLKQHVMIHTGQKPFSCAKCQLKFTQKGNLMKHYDRKHKNTEQSTEETETIMVNNIKINGS